MRWPTLFHPGGVGRQIRALLDLGGQAQLAIAILAALGLNSAVVAGVWKLISPQTFPDYLLLFGLFLGVTPITFPFTAFMLNLALHKVDQQRRRQLFDSPLEVSRKRVDRALADARAFLEHLPDQAHHR